MVSFKMFAVNLFQYLFIALSLIGVAESNSCNFATDNRGTNDKGETEAFQKLKPLVGKRYAVPDPSHVEYSYSVGICTSAVKDQVAEASQGAIQIVIDQVSKKKTVNKLGSLDHAKIVAGTDWIFLEYGEGKNYGNHCGNEPRRTIIMITCDEGISDTKAQMILLEENRNMTSGCYYLFELSHSAICPGSKSGNLSLGSIFIIVLISVIAVYLFFGFLYQRFVLGAKGMEQIPNYGFWQDFGNLQADGCNFICRSGEPRGPRSYKGVGDDQLEEVTETDDHLLPM